jgi:hypothetical protein
MHAADPATPKHHSRSLLLWTGYIISFFVIVSLLVCSLIRFVGYKKPISHSTTPEDLGVGFDLTASYGLA